jgi:serine/threonine protein kinase
MHNVVGVCHRDVKPQNILVCKIVTFISCCNPSLVFIESES